MTDIPQACFSAIWAQIQIGVIQYNNAIMGQLPNVIGCTRVALTGQLSDNLDARMRIAMAQKAPADFPTIRLSLAGGNEQRTSTPTFAAAAGDSVRCHRSSLRAAPAEIHVRLIQYPEYQSNAS